MTFKSEAQQVAKRIRTGGRGFLTVDREDLREAFSISRLTERLATLIFEALFELRILMHPWPLNERAVRLYDLDHEVGAIAHSVLNLAITDGPLRLAAEAFDYKRAGEQAHSQCVQWLEAFDLFLQLIAQKPLEGWDDAAIGRPRSKLAKDLGFTLGLTCESARLRRLAEAVCNVRPSSILPRTRDLVSDSRVTNGAVERFLDALKSQREAFDGVLCRAAEITLDGAETPNLEIDLGRLKLRRRTEEVDA